MTVDLLIDGHNDLAWEIRERFAGDFASIAPGSPNPATHTSLDRLREGGVGGQFWSVFVPGTLGASESVQATFEQIDLVLRLTREFPERLALSTSTKDVEMAMASGRVASLLGAEGGHSIGNSLAVLRIMARLGLRYLTLTHELNCDWADSATDVPGVGGLSEFGLSVVTEMNDLGVMVDLSHVATTTMADAMDHTRAPVIFSHSSCRELVDHPRNVPDEVLTRLRTNGGICMVTFVPEFVSAGDTATLANVADHFDHAREVAGIDHVGIGGDFDGTESLPIGLDDVSCYVSLRQELHDRGWSAADWSRLAQRNILRVMADCENAMRG